MTGDVRPRKFSWRERLVEAVVSTVLFGGVLMIASPVGQLLSAMWDTVWQIATGQTSGGR